MLGKSTAVHVEMTSQIPYLAPPISYLNPTLLGCYQPWKGVRWTILKPLFTLVILWNHPQLTRSRRRLDRPNRREPAKRHFFTPQDVNLRLWFFQKVILSTPTFFLPHFFLCWILIPKPETLIYHGFQHFWVMPHHMDSTACRCRTCHPHYPTFPRLYWAVTK